MGVPLLGEAIMVLTERSTATRQPKVARLLNLEPGDSIVCAYARPASGPGWSNFPLWVIVMNGDKELRTECLQPEQQTPEMLTLYNVNLAAVTALTQAVKNAAKKWD